QICARQMQLRSTSSFCSPTHFKSTFDYYAILGATPKIDFTDAFIIRGEAYDEWLFRLQRRKKLHCSYGCELRVLTPLHQRFEHFIEDYDSRDNRRAGKMPRQTWMISADYTAYFKNHARRFVSPSNQITERFGCCHTLGKPAKRNRWQYGANASSTFSPEEPNCDRSYRWFADCLSACAATSTCMRCSAAGDNDQPK